MHTFSLLFSMNSFYLYFSLVGVSIFYENNKINTNRKSFFSICNTWYNNNNKTIRIIIWNKKKNVLNVLKFFLSKCSKKNKIFFHIKKFFFFYKNFNIFFFAHIYHLFTGFWYNGMYDFFYFFFFLIFFFYSILLYAFPLNTRKTLLLTYWFLTKIPFHLITVILVVGTFSFLDFVLFYNIINFSLFN